jgi:hypothetical protein
MLLNGIETLSGFENPDLKGAVTVTVDLAAAAV